MSITRFTYTCRSGPPRASLHISHDDIETLCGRKITKIWVTRHREHDDKICVVCLRVDLNK